MEKVLNYLCPGISEQQLVKHSALVATYLSDATRNGREMDVVSSDEANLKCRDCGYNVTTIQDNISGDIICLGVNSSGCGLVIQQDNLTMDYELSLHRTTFSNLYSYEGNMRSYIKNDKTMSRLNENVEKHVHKFGKEDQPMTTSEMFKDKQRQKVYNLIEDIEHVCNFDTHVIMKVKEVFNEYRSKMTRIHKLNVVLASLFYLVLNNYV